MTKQNTLIGICLATLTSVIWSVNFIIAKELFPKIPPVSLAFYRWTIATIIISPFVIKKFIAEWKIIRQHLLFFLLASLTGVSLFNTLVYIGAPSTSAINLSLFGTTTSPIFSVILARIFLKEKVGLSKVIGLSICVIGILYLLLKGNINNLLMLKFSEGDLWVIAAAFSFSFYNILVKKKPADVSTGSFLFTTFFIGTLLLVPFFVYEHRHAASVQWNSKLLFDILYLGIATSIISFFLWNLAINRLGAGRASLFGNLIPVFSSIEAVFILDEQFTMEHVISMLLVFLGLVIANIRFGKM